MPPDNAVPDVQLLKRFLLGQLNRAEAEPLERYLEQHPELASTLAGLVNEDTLVSSLRGAAGQPAADPPELAGLMEKLSRLRPANEATVGMAEGDRVPLPSGAPEDTFAGLSPAQGPGEVGRLGGYRVLKLLGAGGMGMVYQAEDVQLQRAVALKVMKAEVAKNPSNRERFLREARAAARLKSDHVVTIHQVGEDRDVVFLAMEFLEGLSLEDWLKKGRTPTLAQAARIGRQIALGLAEAHACGLIHRDIKPGNVWLDSRQQGRVKLLDFGLARGGADEHQLTQSGAILGTPAFMAPEQARGEKVDHRVDLFSLGVVLYRLTTGRLPFRGDNTMSVLMSLATDTPAPPREINPAIPPRLAALIERLLSKDREQRPATAKAVAEELAVIEREAAQPAAEERTVVGAASVSERLAPTAPSRSRLRWLVAASLLLLLGGVVAAIVVIIRDKQGKEVARLTVPEGGKAEIVDDGKGQPSPKEGVRIEPAPLAPMLPGEPLAPTALVRQPAKLPGVRSWSIERRHQRRTTAGAYRPDGKRLAVGYRDGSIRVWEPESGRLVQVLLGSGAISALAWSPDGRVLAAGHVEQNRPVRLWDADKGQLVQALEAPARSNVWSLAWSPDGRSVGAVADDAAFLSWNAADGKLLKTMPTNDRPQVVSPDAKWLAGIDQKDGRTTIWDAIKGTKVRVLATPQWKELWTVAWSPNGKRLAFAEANGLHVWDVESGKECFWHLEPCMHGLSWSPDGRSLAYQVRSGGPAVIEVAKGAKPTRLDTGVGLPVAWSLDGKTIVAIANGFGDDAGWVRLFDATTGKRLRTLSEGAEPPFYFRLSPDGQSVATIIGNRTVVSSLDTGQIVAVLEEAGGWALDWSPDSKWVATTGPDHALLIWSADGKTRRALVGHKDNVNSVAWSPDGKSLASIGFDKRVLLWDVESGERRRELGPFQGKPDWVRWSPDGRHIVFHEESAGWNLWDVQRNKLANDPKQWAVNVFLFAPDGRSVLTALYADSPFRLRDLTTGKDLGVPSSACTWRWDGARPSWSPDGRLFAIAQGDTIELWRGDLRRRLRTLKSTSGNMEKFIVFSGDGRLVAGRAGERLHVWETDTGRLRGILLLGQHNNGLTIAADGHYTGNEQVERGIVMVVQKDDGTQEVLEPADFEQKYGWKNQPGKVHLLQPLPPPPYPQPGMPMGPNALVREPAELPDANAMSWTVETVNSRGSVNAVAYRPDAKLLATGGDDGTIRLWDTSSGKLVRMLVGEPVGSLSWSKDGKVLTALRPGDIQGREWDADTGRLLRRITGAAIPAAKTARSPDGKQTATADKHGVRITDTANGQLLHILEEETGDLPVYYNKLTWSSDSRCLALGYNSSLRIVEAATGQGRGRLQEAHHLAAWSPDGRMLAAKGTDNSLQLWDAVTLRPLRALDFGGKTSSLPLAAMEWSPNGKMLASGGEGHFFVWSAETGKLLLWKDVGSFGGLAWSPDGGRLAFSAGGGDAVHPKGAVYVWQADNGKLLLEKPVPVYRLAWSPDGKKLAVSAAWEREGAARTGIALIDAASGEFVAKGQETGLGVALRWSSDGKTFASLHTRSASGGASLCVWDGVRCTLLRSTPLHGMPETERVAWSPDGRVIAWAGNSQVHLCDADGQLLGVLLPFDTYGQLAITAAGHYRGSARVERDIRMVVQKRDGSSETLTPSEFERKYHFKNDPAKVRLIGQ